MENKIKSFIKENTEEMFKVLKDLCLIPAPSHFEHKRAEYCKNWLEKNGAEGVYIDEALNVIFPLNCEGKNEITVFAAHTDTVFPDTEPMPYSDDGKIVRCPGVGDDTACVVVLLFMAKFFIEEKILSENGIMFVCDACEEGLGNLKGMRQLFKDFGGRIKTFFSWDGRLPNVADVSVGSHRYEVEVKTEGGHSWGKFGNKNAIAELAKIAAKIYEIEVPEKEGTKTSYNVGTISGGTSVNTIAQNAKMLCEYRSTDRECLESMKDKFEAIFEEARTEGVEVNVVKVGDRPGSITDLKKIEALKEIVVPIIENVTNKEVSLISLSTDCNIPLSLGVQSLCIGTNIQGGAHTREEWVDKAGLPLGLEMAIKIGLEF